MKKVFTLVMVLLVATAGYSQVKKVSMKAEPLKAEKEIAITGEETLNNVKGTSGMTWNFDQNDLDYTFYDWQTNTASKNWTMTFPDGSVGFAYTISGDESHTDRGTNIVIYNPNTGEWTSTGGKIENRKTGFGCATRYKENGILVVSRDANSLDCGVYIIEDKDNLPAAGTVAPIIEWTKDDRNIHFPTAMCTGPERDHIHILFTGLNYVDEAGQTSPFYYFRSMDGGQTWEEFMSIEYLGRDYCPRYGSGQDAYFMETTEDNRIDIVVNTRRSDGAVLTSTDEGNTWTRTVFYHNPGIDVDYGEDVYYYPRWTSALWTGQTLHVAYEFNGATGDETSTSYYPGIGGVAYWNSLMPYRGEGVEYGFDPNNPRPPVNGQPFIMDSAYIMQDIYASWWLWSDATHEMWPEFIGYLTTLDADGNPEDPYTATEWNIEDRTLHGHYNGGICEMPVLLRVPGSNDLVAVWIAMDENNKDGGENFYMKLFARASYDGGQTWTDMVALTNDIIFMMAECVYPQAAIANGQLVVAFQVDNEVDSWVINTGGDSQGDDNLYYGMVFDLQELFPTASIGENVPAATSMTVYPNPAQGNVTVNLSNANTITISNLMGQMVSTVKGHIGANSIDISNLSSGVYFISAGNNIEKFVVK